MMNQLLAQIGPKSKNWTLEMESTIMANQLLVLELDFLAPIHDHVHTTC